MKADYIARRGGCGSSAQWSEAGIEYRSSLVTKVGGVIRSHKHSYSHVAFVTKGWWSVREITPSGLILEYQLANGDFQSNHSNFHPIAARRLIEAGHTHEFTLLGSTGVGEILCIWPSGELRPSGWAE